MDTKEKAYKMSCYLYCQLMRATVRIVS